MEAEILSNTLINIDKNKMSQVIRNLISNAMKFTPEGGNVTVDISSFIDVDSDANIDDRIDEYEDKDDDTNDNNKKWLRVRVTDTGPGVSLVTMWFASDMCL